MRSVALAAVFVSSFATATAAQPLGGLYDVAGTSLDGTPYSGQAEIILTSDVTCEIVWVTGGQESLGICMRAGNAFAASYVIEDQVGLIIYQIMPDGTLDGTWTLAGMNSVGTEVLTPR